MYGIGRAEAARFELHSKCFELHSKVLRATQQKGVGAVSVTRFEFPHFLPRGSGAPPDLSFTHIRTGRGIVRCSRRTGDKPDDSHSL